MPTRIQLITAALSVALLALSAGLLFETHQLLAKASSVADGSSSPEALSTPPPSGSGSQAEGDTCHIGVWMQSPENAQAWKDLGVECYVGQWNPITDTAIQTLRAADMPFWTDAKEGFAPGTVALPAQSQSLLTGWLTATHEPDLSQDGAGGPAVPPSKVIEEARSIKDKDPTHPVMVYLSSGVAIPQWFGMGSDSTRWEDYYREIVASPAIDLIAFDYYPWNSDAEPSGNGLVQPDPSYVVDAVKRLRTWSGGKPVFPTLAASQVNEKFRVPTTEQTSALVSQLLDAGAAGIIWFGHDFDASGQFVRDAHPLQVEDGSAEMVKTLNDLVRQRLG